MRLPPLCHQEKDLVSSPLIMLIEEKIKCIARCDAGVQELLAVFKELDEFLGPGDIWLHGHRRDQACSLSHSLSLYILLTDD